MVKAMRKKITETIIVACLGLVLGFSGFIHSQKSFFIWTDGYVAGAVDEEVSIAFTFLTPDWNLEQNLESVSFSDDSSVSVESVQVSKMDTRYKVYQFYGIIVDVKLNEPGEMKTNAVVFHYTDGTEEKYALGDWVYDIGAMDDGGINTWESVAASSSSTEFSYEYTCEKGDISDCQIYTGIDHATDTEWENGTKLSGTIDISESEAPIKYIRAKIAYTEGNQEKVTYGKGCYCGAMGLTDEDIELSRERNQ